jgi:hypothetical protein
MRTTVKILKNQRSRSRNSLQVCSRPQYNRFTYRSVHFEEPAPFLQAPQTPNIPAANQLPSTRSVFSKRNQNTMAIKRFSRLLHPSHL